MFDINACYKIIFEALFEQLGIDNIVQKVHEYTNAYVYLILTSGEIISCACSEQEHKIAAIENKHVSIYEYEKLQINIRKMDKSAYSDQYNHFYHIAEFEVSGKKIGYSLLVFTDSSQKNNMEKVNEIFCQALGMYFKDVRSEVYDNITMRRQICAWTIFSREVHKAGNLEILKKEVPGNYFLVYVRGFENQLNSKNMFCKIQTIWNHTFIDFGEKNPCILFFKVDEERRSTIISELKKLGFKLCASEIFTDLSSCLSKKDFLKRMSKFDGQQRTDGIMEEKDWYVETVFSYAASMFDEAGFNDYFIEQLCKADSEKNLELYDTLKMYLLCENNISATASKLHVHRNTLVYRLKQIQSSIGRNINDSNVSKELLSFMIMYDIVRQNGE